MDYYIIYNYIWCIWILTVVLRKAKSEMKATQCTGKMFSLTCGSQDYVIHVLYEWYSYNPTQESLNQCTYDSSYCSEAEFINPVSSQYCNGYSQCSFLVTPGRFLMSCDQNSTEITVLYNCMSKHRMVDICRPYNLRNGKITYFKSPNYPHDLLQPIKCQCNVTGQNISAEVYEHQKSKNSTVVFMFVTNKVTLHVNDVTIRNRMLFSEMDYVQLILDNRISQELFKLWMKISSNAMSISCQSHPIDVKPSSTIQQTSSSNYQTVLYTSSMSYQIKTSLIEPSEKIKISKTELYYSSFPESNYSLQETPFLSLQSFNPTILLTDQSMMQDETISSGTYLTNLIKPSNQVHPNTTNMSNQTDLQGSSVIQTMPEILPSTSTYLMISSTIGIELDIGKSQEQLDQDTDLRVIIVTVCVFTIIIIISVALGVFIYRRKHRQLTGYNTNEDNDSDRDIYHAYNFSFQNKYDKN